MVVTGGATGIGAATARLLGRLGADVAIFDREDSSEVERDILSEGGRCTSAVLDVTDTERVHECISALGPISAAVISAGITTQTDWLDEGWPTSYEAIMAVNLKGAIECARACFVGMRESGGGSIVLVGSLAGRSGGLTATAQYAASKGGLHAFARWLARKGGGLGIRANAVAPASIRTPMMQGREVDLSNIPLGRMGEADEVAAAIAFLCSDASSFITGVVLDVNGGVYMG